MDSIRKETIEKQLNKAIILLCFLEVAILRWLNLHTYGGYILDVLILTSIFLCFKKYDIKTLIISVLICIYILISYLLFGGTLKNTIANIRDIFPILLIINFYIYLKRNFDIYKNFDKLFPYINIYMILNVIALILEAKGITYLSGIRVFYGHTFTYIQDSISGLLGVYGQPLFGFYAIFVLFYNYIYTKQLDNKKTKIILNIYNVSSLMFTLVIASIGDNRIYYIFLLMFIFLYFINLFTNKYGSEKTIKFLFISIILCIVLFFFMYNNLGLVKNYVNDLLGALINGINPDNMYYSGSGERLGLIVYFIQYLNPLFGNGVGNLRWTQGLGLGFKHFGISDLGTILCMGGFILLFLYFLLFYFLFNYISENKIITLTIFLITVVVMFSTQIVFSTSAIILYILVLITIGWNVHN